MIVNTLYFGCRSAAKDHHYGAEWQSLCAEKKITYRVTFSRDGPEGVKRTYVQDLIQEDARTIWELLKKGGWVYISGSASFVLPFLSGTHWMGISRSSNKMPASVKEAIRAAVETEGDYSEEESRKYVDAMVREGRLLEESWS